MAALQYDYIAFVDEAGEPGLRRVRPMDPDGASEWLMISAVVMRARWESEIPAWLSAVKEEVGLDRNGPLHFRNLSPKRRLAVAEWMAKQPLRCFVICSNKKNMRGYRNPEDPKDFVPLTNGKAVLPLPVPMSDRRGGLYDTLILRRLAACEVAKTSGCRREPRYFAQFRGSRLTDVSADVERSW